MQFWMESIRNVMSMRIAVGDWMITEILYYNMAWLFAAILAGVLSGIVWAWRPKIAVIIFGMAIGMLIWTGWRTNLYWKQG